MDERFGIVKADRKAVARAILGIIVLLGIEKDIRAMLTARALA